MIEQNFINQKEKKMHWIEASLEKLELSLKYQRKSFLTQCGLFIFNALLAALNGYGAIVSHSVISAWGFGGMCATLLWTTVFCLMEWAEYREEKRRYFYYKKLQDESSIPKKEEELSAAITATLHAKARYEEAQNELRRDKLS
jgi:hypothetical protein